MSKYTQKQLENIVVTVLPNGRQQLEARSLPGLLEDVAVHLFLKCEVMSNRALAVQSAIIDLRESGSLKYDS